MDAVGKPIEWSFDLLPDVDGFLNSGMHLHNYSPVIPRNCVALELLANAPGNVSGKFAM